MIEQAMSKQAATRQAIKQPAIDATDRAIINALQGGFPLSRRPFADAAAALTAAGGARLEEAQLIERIKDLLVSGVATRFGPMFNADRMGGAFCLCAMAVPAERFEDVTAHVNAHIEVAHNYERRHALNMWFVLACDAESRIGAVAREIEQETGIEVLLFPKLREYFVGMRLEA